MKINEGLLDAKGLKVHIVLGRFNEFIGSKLLDGAKDALKRHGLNEDDLSLTYVPGAFEMPLVAKKIASKGDCDVVITLGAVIRGSTPHFDYVANEVTKGIANVSLQTNVPIIFGVLTTDNIEQAIERAGTKSGNKGYDAAMSAIEMANLFKSL